jgi:hypothetical protein
VRIVWRARRTASAYEGDVRGGDCRVGARAHGDTEVGTRQRGCVVEPVAYDGNGEALRLQAGDLRGLFLGQDIADHTGDADLRGDELGGGGAVARQQNRLESECAQFADCLRARGAQHVAGGEDRADRTVPGDRGDRASLCPLGRDGRSQLRRER